MNALETHDKENLTWEIEDIKKNQMEIRELKNSRTKTIHVLDKLNTGDTSKKNP